MAYVCINCHEQYEDDNDPCYGHEDATPEWPVFHTPSVWADGFGRWHASVPLTGNPRQECAAARALIRAELVARHATPADPDGRGIRFSVTRECVTNHGTVIYGER